MASATLRERAVVRALRFGDDVARIPTWHVNVPERQVEFYDVGAQPDGPPTRVFSESETFEVLSVLIAVTILFAPAL